MLAYQFLLVKAKVYQTDHDVLEYVQDVAEYRQQEYASDLLDILKTPDFHTIL